MKRTTTRASWTPSSGWFLAKVGAPIDRGTTNVVPGKNPTWRTNKIMGINCLMIVASPNSGDEEFPAHPQIPARVRCKCHDPLTPFFSRLFPRNKPASLQRTDHYTEIMKRNMTFNSDNLFVALWGLRGPLVPCQWNFFRVKEVHDSILEFRFWSGQVTSGLHANMA